VIRRNRRVVVERPVFHGYLFVKFDLSGWRWRAINSTQGIIRLLPMGSEEPVALPRGFVEALQSRNVAVPVITKVLETFAANRARHRPTRCNPRYLHTVRRVAPYSGGHVV